MFMENAQFVVKLLSTWSSDDTCIDEWMRCETAIIINLLAQKHDKVTCATKQIERDSKDTDATNRAALEKYK